MNYLLFLTFVIISITIKEAISTSSGLEVYICDALSPLLGCDPDYWVGGDRLNCNMTGHVMFWATQARRTDTYQLTIGDDDTNPETSYTPNELLTVNIRVTEYNRKYRGLLLYAVNTTEHKIGTWELFDEDPLVLRSPWEPGHSCYPSVMHASAAHLPYHLTIKFRAPPKGTGSITFRCLIKEGDANEGDLWWPNSVGDTSLTEGKTSTPNKNWFRGELGQSCTEVCAEQKLKCNADTMATLDSESALTEALGTFQVCEKPILSGCSELGLGATSSSDGFCYYADPTCAEQNRPNATTDCEAKSTNTADGHRFCYCDGKGSGVSGSLKTTPHTFLILLLLIVTFYNTSNTSKNSSKTPWIALALLLVLLGSLHLTSAHNWLNSASRANRRASTEVPCPARTSHLPHAQVGPNQKFQIEWMTGHVTNGYTYFAVVHEKDVDKLKLHTSKLFEDYINNAPNPEQIGTPKVHRRKENENNNEYKRQIKTGDSNYFERPEAFTGRYSGQGYMFEYHSEDVEKDRRVSYKSEKYPWLEAVHRFKHVYHLPSEFDAAEFSIPGRSGPGRYIVHYVWRGYYDCMEVDLLEKNTQHVYGELVGEDFWTRIDHCAFPNPRSVHGACIEVVEDPSFCINRCMGRDYSSCWAVGILPAHNPATVYEPFQDVSLIPWTVGGCNGTIDKIRESPEDTYVCFPIRPRIATATVGEYEVSLDPLDPIFYGTCLYRNKNIQFQGVETSSKSGVDVDWRFRDSCITCGNKAENDRDPSDMTVARWEVKSDGCVNCDEEPSEVPEKVDWVIARENAVCDGIYESWARPDEHNTCENPEDAKCLKRIWPIGRSYGDISPQTCRTLALKDEECSNYVTYSKANYTSRACFCYKTDPCCKVCSSRGSSDYDIYELIPSEPDPICSTGLVSAHTWTNDPIRMFNSTMYTGCCSTECGDSSTCRRGTSNVVEVGFCCSDCSPERSCNDYGPPCVIETKNN